MGYKVVPLFIFNTMDHFLYFVNRFFFMTYLLIEAHGFGKKMAWCWEIPKIEAGAILEK
jgi:hypothetical protein